MEGDGDEDEEDVEYCWLLVGRKGVYWGGVGNLFYIIFFLYGEWRLWDCYSSGDVFFYIGFFRF